MAKLLGLTSADNHLVNACLLSSLGK